MSEQIKLRADFAQRYDGKFNVWFRRDIVYHGDDERPPFYGDWTVAQVTKTKEEALVALRQLKKCQKSSR